MNVDFLIAGILAAGLLVYLAFAIFMPEKF
jgi:K+-transporting ATPase KdpF subunit